MVQHLRTRGRIKAVETQGVLVVAMVGQPVVLSGHVLQCCRAHAPACCVLDLRVARKAVVGGMADTVMAP